MHICDEVFHYSYRMIFEFMSFKGTCNNKYIGVDPPKRCSSIGGPGETGLRDGIPKFGRTALNDRFREVPDLFFVVRDRFLLELAPESPLSSFSSSATQTGQSQVPVGSSVIGGFKQRKWYT